MRKEIHMNKVYVTTHPTRIDRRDGVRRPIDITQAAEYGELVVLLPEGMLSLTPAPTVRELRYGLRDFTDDDYLLPLGDPALIAMAGALCAFANNGRFKVLRWNRPLYNDEGLVERGGYIPIQVDLNIKKERQ